MKKKKAKQSEKIFNEKLPPVDQKVKATILIKKQIIFNLFKEFIDKS